MWTDLRFFPGICFSLLAFAAIGIAVDLSEIDPSDPVEGKNHWAFRPLQNEGIPAVQAENWPRSPLDRFVLEKLETAGLQPVADANRPDLLRRVTFQLTGLPPTPQDLQAFLADERPDAFDRILDQLLASPHFGERWGRHWLDLARYADSNGLDENFLFREAWRYRNWVIDALNTGMPFDRFILEQLAGDLLPFDSIAQRDRQRIAAGFLVLGPKVLLGNNEKNQRMEVADELIDTVGKTILGQTLGCCRCHDHKFDPVPTADYYALAGIFSSTRVMETRYMLGEQRSMERLVGLGPEGLEADEVYEAFWREQPRLVEQKKQAEAALEAIKQEKPDDLTAILAKHPEAVAAEAKPTAEPVRSQEERIAAQMEQVAEIAKRLANPPKIPPRAMIPMDVEQPADEQIRLAGQFDQLGKLVPRGFLSVLCDGDRIEIPPQQSGRIALAGWLTNGEQRTGQLAARVLANRGWHHLFGRGIVRTVDNFGRTGEEPTHPELLDYLAGDLIRSGWSLKKMVRDMVSSHTFALSSHYDPQNHAVDPDNRWLWRANRRRLDPESYRDAMLTVAGQLDLSPMDSTVWYLGDQATAVGPNTVRRRTNFPCRSVYLPVIRNDLPELFEVFDFANPHTATGARPSTTAPNQALFMLNDDMVMDAAEAIAQRVLAEVPTQDLQGRVEFLYRIILNTSPTSEVQQALETYLRQTETRLISEGAEAPERRAIALACHALIASSPFQFLD